MTSRRDRHFAEYRAAAMSKPLTRANTYVFPKIELAGGIAVGLSVNK
jgi:hypothetical protein